MAESRRYRIFETERFAKDLDRLDPPVRMRVECVSENESVFGDFSRTPTVFPAGMASTGIGIGDERDTESSTKSLATRIFMERRRPFAPYP